MSRIVLILWFTITTILWPGVCCCSFALPSQRMSQEVGLGENEAASDSGQSCCCHETQACRDDGKQDHSEPAKPAKCPCEQGKQNAASLPSTSQDVTNWVAQLKLFDAQSFYSMAPSPLEFMTVSPTRAHAIPAVFRLAGRDLLAAYSLLRC